MSRDSLRGMRKLIKALIIILGVDVLLGIAACSSAQRAEEHAAIDCALVDLGAVTHELEGSDNAVTKGAVVSTDAYACWQQARAAGKLAAGSAGSSGSSGSGSAR